MSSDISKLGVFFPCLCMFKEHAQVFQNNQPERAMGHGDDARHPGSGLGNMVLLLNGDVLIIKGRAARTARWEYYGPNNQPARRTSK